MTNQPMIDYGQTLTAPEGKVVGFLDSQDEFEAFAAALQDAGFSSTGITSLHGEDGIHLLERLKEHSFFFADSENNIIEYSIREVQQGHYAVSVEVRDRKQALEILSLAKPHGGHGFTYFGMWVSEQLPTRKS